MAEMISSAPMDTTKEHSLNLINGLGHFISSLGRVFHKNKNKNHNHHHNHPKHPEHPPCPCMEQKYVLSEGFKVKLEEGKEVSHDFPLELSPFKNCGTVSGRVVDKKGDPLKNALVKVFNLNHDPITHVFTNEDGEYLICLPAGHYLVKAVR